MAHVLPDWLPALKKKNLNLPQKLWKIWKNPKLQNAGYTPKLFNIQRIRRSQQLVTGKTSSKSQTWDDSNVEIIDKILKAAVIMTGHLLTGHLPTSGAHLLVSYLFDFSYYSWGSWDKNPGEYMITLFQEIRENTLKTNGKMKILREIEA